MAREVVQEMNEAGMAISGSDNEYFKDMMKIIPILHIVDNNSNSTVGGGGTPRQPLAPPIAN